MATYTRTRSAASTPDEFRRAVAAWKLRYALMAQGYSEDAAKRMVEAVGECMDAKQRAAELEREEYEAAAEE